AWNQPKDAVDFFDIKGAVEAMTALFKLPELTFIAGGVEPFYHPGKAAAILCNGQLIGTLGEIHPDVQDAFAIEKPVYYFELDFSKLVAFSSETLPILPPSRFPDTYRDIAMLMEAEMPSSTIVDFIKAFKSDKTRSVEIFDLYTGDKIPAGMKSIAIRIRYGSFEKTLTDEEVSKVHQKIVNSLIADVNITLR
ncbi:MAG: phenylalanine--tRNA ligase subunit beta, partial [Deltaproteobacteria bacterium HGW-Deltaproteobacteria-23]